MKKYGRAAISEFIGDNIVYRNLVPLEARLPSLCVIRNEIVLASGITPRKTTTEYAQVISYILKAAHELGMPGTQINRVIFIGDTRLNDTTAFANICRTGTWSGMAFIGEENEKPSRIDIEEVDVGTVMHANRWAALSEFQAHCEQQGFVMDEHMVVLLDLDKTILGARGRNDQVINQVRIEAATQTVQNILDPQFALDEFITTYNYFNQTRFHPFTSDNQDYLVYICLVTGQGLLSPDELVEALEDGSLANIDSLMQWVDHRATELSPKLREVHKDVFQRVRSGDSTPFKAFREAEYLATVARMGQMEAGTPVSELLSQEIVITQEVRSMAIRCREQGTLLFGLSDKPDEASIPTDELASQGYLPVHRVETSVIGSNDG
jgi:hypothetical protein